MSNEKMFFDQFKELLNESAEPKKHEASHTNLKNYMEEGKRKISEFSQDSDKAVVYYNSEDEEYCVKFYKDGEYQKDSDYFTNDKDDAIGTAKVQIKLVETDEVPVSDDPLVEEELEELEERRNQASYDRTHPIRGEVFDVYLDGKKVDTVFFKHFSAEEVKDSLVGHDGYSSDIEVKLVEGLKGDMGEEVSANDMGDSLKGYEEGDLYDIIKFLKGYKAETISDAIEKMKKWKLDSFNESNLSREMGLNEAQEAFHGSQKSGEYVGSKKVAGVEVDYYVKYKVAGKSKTVDRFEARFGKDKDDVLTVSGRALTKEDKLFGHLYNKFSDKIKKDDGKETPAMTKKREENYKEFEDAIKVTKKGK